MSDDLVNRIKSNIAKTGHPLEFHVLKTLRRYGWIAYPHALYSSKNISGKWFEVDILAQKRNPKLAIEKTLIIECKKSEKPWVFFKDKTKLSVYSLILSSADDDDAAYLNLEKSGYLQKHHYFSDDDFCTWYMHPFLSVASNSQDVATSESKPNAIYDAINQTINAIRFYFDQVGNIFDEVKKNRYKFEGFKTVMFYPIIVMEGDLFEAELTGESVVTPVNHIKFITRRDIEEPFIVTRPSGQFAVLSRREVVIDIVKKEYFEKFLEQFEFY